MNNEVSQRPTVSSDGLLLRRLFVGHLLVVFVASFFVKFGNSNSVAELLLAALQTPLTGAPAIFLIAANIAILGAFICLLANQLPTAFTVCANAGLMLGISLLLIWFPLCVAAAVVSVMVVEAGPGFVCQKIQFPAPVILWGIGVAGLVFCIIQMPRPEFVDICNAPSDQQDVG